MMPPTMNAGPDEFIPTRPSLLHRLKNWENRDDWKTFFETYWRLIFSVALKSGLTEDEAEDVVQETIVSVARQMPGFQYDQSGSFKAWLLQITRRRISDQLRRRPPLREPPTEESTRTNLLERLPAPEPKVEDVWEEEWQKNLLEAAIAKVKGEIKPRQFQIFDLAVIKQWPAAEVARGLNVSAAQVYLTKHRVSRLIRDTARRLERDAARRMSRS
jgi:RNA polymerase sigma factor (sigma-70 family)